jgi:tRNA A58 N-methylase Trm61
MSAMQVVCARHLRLAWVLCAVALGGASVAGQVAQAPVATEHDREQWQKVPEIFASMGVRPGSRVADVGAGSGFFTVRLARAVGPTGRVYAVDVNPESVRDLKERVRREQLTNVEVIVGDHGNPRLPSSLDAVLIVNAYHEMHEHQPMLDNIRQALKLDGRLVIVEPIAQGRRGTTRAIQQSNHEIDVEFVVEDLRQSGFEVVTRQDRFVENLLDRDTEWLIVARPQY